MYDKGESSKSITMYDICFRPQYRKSVIKGRQHIYRYIYICIIFDLHPKQNSIFLKKYETLKKSYNQDGKYQTFILGRKKATLSAGQKLDLLSGICQASLLDRNSIHWTKNIRSYHWSEIRSSMRNMIDLNIRQKLEPPNDIPPRSAGKKNFFF